MMTLIQLVPASGEPRRFTLANGETIIGRRPDCRIVLDAPSIRHRHARLFSVDGSTVIHAIDDAWPVYVNGEPVARRALADGDDVELGPYRMRYVDGSGPERIDETPTGPDPAPGGDPATDAPAHEPIPGPFTPAVGDDPLPESSQTFAGEHEESEDAPPLFFNPLAATSNPHESADVDDLPHPTAAKTGASRAADDRDPEAAAEETAPQRAGDETAPPAADDMDLQTPADNAYPASAIDEHDLQSVLDEIDAWPDHENADMRPANDEINPYQHAIETDPTSTVDAIDSTSSVDETDSRPAAGNQQPDTRPDYHLDILTGINQGRRIALTRDLVVLGFNRQRLVELHNDAGALSLRRVDDKAVVHLNGLPIPNEPTEARPGDVISLQRIDLRIHQD